jgi:hypothetical protein
LLLLVLFGDDLLKNILNVSVVVAVVVVIESPAILEGGGGAD